ncbi:hypothetical protein [Flexivirga meconopsidis]|uniref:hypothetical protein n=1 Tax=Flexivirga meconopsidis TaxID=2977121 RepID=UPI00223F132B|nr:hypothetical protein [Flexivirga meconopsidis]
MSALDGDPGQLWAAADRCLVIADECDAASGALLGALSSATAGWSGAAAVQFAGVGAAHRRLLQTAREALRSLAVHTRGFADLLDEAQRELRRTQAQAREGRARLRGLHARERLAIQAGEEDARAAIGRLIEDTRGTLTGIDTRIAELEHRMLLARRRFAGQLDELLPPGMLADIERLWSTGGLAVMLGGAAGRLFQASKLLIGTARYGPGAFGRDLKALEEPLAKLLRGPGGTARVLADRVGVARRPPGGLTTALSPAEGKSPVLRRLLVEYEAATPGITDLVKGRGHDGLRDAADRAMGLIEVGGVLMLRGPGWAKVAGAVAVGSWAAWRIGGAMYDHKVTIADVGRRAKTDGSAVLGSQAGQEQLAKDIQRSKPVVRGAAALADDLLAESLIVDLTKIKPTPSIPNPLYGRVPTLSEHTDELVDRVTPDALAGVFGRQAPPVITPPPLPEANTPRPEPSRRITPPIRRAGPRLGASLSGRDLPIDGPSLLPRRQDVVQSPEQQW